MPRLAQDRASSQRNATATSQQFDRTRWDSPKIKSIRFGDQRLSVILRTRQGATLFLNGLKQLLLRGNELSDTLFHKRLLHMRNVNRFV